MAKYADYVKRLEENIEQDVQQLDKTKTRDVSESVVKRFDGKSIEDVLVAYDNLEKMNGRQGEDLGKLRKTVDQLLELQSQIGQSGTQTHEAEAVTEITADELYDKPDEAVSKVVRRESKETSDRIKALEEQLVTKDIESKMGHLRTKYTGWEEDIKTTEFLAWVGKSAYRTRLAQDANRYDFGAADALLEAWNEHKGSSEKDNQRQEREQQFRDATLETGAPAGSDPVETVSRSEYIEKKIAAKSGNRDAQRWLQSHGSEITRAYSEGRLSN